MTTGIVTARRVLIVAAAVLLAVAAWAAQPSTAASISLSVNSWQHDLSTNTISYSLSVSGSAGSECFSSTCSWSVQAGDDGDGPITAHSTLASGSFRTSEESLSFSGTSEGSRSGGRPVTHIRARVSTPNGVTAMGWQRIASYPSATVELDIDTWDADLATNQVSYKVSATAASLSAPGQVCYGGGRCQLYIQAAELVGGEPAGTYTLASRTSTASWVWTRSTSADTTQTFARPITHVRAYVRNTTTGEEITTGWEQVASYPSATVELNVLKWHWNADTQRADFAYELSGSSLSAPGGPCYGGSRCYWQIIGHSAGGNRTLASGSLGTWRWTFHATGDHEGLSVANGVSSITARVYSADRELVAQQPVQLLSAEQLDEVVDDLAGDPYLPVVPALVAGHKLCDSLLTIQGTHTLRSSVNDQYLTCSSAISSGASVKVAIAATLAVVPYAYVASDATNAIVTTAVNEINWTPVEDDQGRLVGYVPPGYYDPASDDRLSPEEVEPEPSADGAGALLPPSCPPTDAFVDYWNDKAFDKSIDTHHIIPHSGERGQDFQDRIDDADLLIDLDLDAEWNKVRIPHAGRHPNRYHSYISDTLDLLLDYVSEGTSADAQQKRLNNAMQHLRYWLQNDPLMVRAYYWRC